MRVDATPTRVGVIGVGRIGLPVVARLVAEGLSVRAHDIRPSVQGDVETVGAQWAPTAAAAVEDAHVLVSVLPGNAELAALMLGDDTDAPLLDRLPGSCVWVDLTSGSPELGVRLAAAAGSRHIAYLDAPTGGGVDAARRGELTLYVGGNGAVLQRVRPVLAAVCAADGIRHMGGAGAGYVTKLLVNLLWFGQAIAVGEALLLGQSVGLAPSVLAATFADGPASSAFIRTHLPSLLDGDYLATFGLDRCVEELEAIEALARSSQTPYDLSSVVTRLHQDTLAHFGPIDGELLGVALLEHQANTRLGHRRQPDSSSDPA